MKGGTPDDPSKAPAPFVPGEADAFLRDAEEQWEQGYNNSVELEGRELTREEQEAEKAYCKAFCEELNKRLQAHGIRVFYWMPDGMGQGYYIRAYEALTHRTYSCEFKYGEWLEIAERQTETAGRAIISLLEKKILDARETFLQRMLS